MDMLKREMERKKKAIEQAKAAAAAAVDDDDDDKNNDGRNKRTFLRASDLRKQQEVEEEKLRKRRRQHSETEKETTTDGSQQLTTTTTLTKKTEHDDSQLVDAAKGIAQTQTTKARNVKETQSLTGKVVKWTPAEVSRRLREMGLPIRLFGERTIQKTPNDNDKDGNDHSNNNNNEYDDSQRVERLQQAMAVRNDALSGLSELDEFRLSSGHGIRNTFLEKDHDKEANAISMAAVAAATAETTKAKAAVEKSNSSSGKSNSKQDSDGEAVKRETQEEQDAADPHKRIYKYFKGLLKDWEHELALRPESVARSIAGKNDTKTLKQCKDYIRPLFKLCKNRQLEPGLMSHIIKIVDFCQQGEFVRAHDAYMDVAIGRAAWPIGVTMVGIHARSGRAKIESANVAHVMNSELQRKYLTSVKRLMSYAQKTREDVDPSKKVLS